MHPILVLFSHHAEKNRTVKRNGEVLSFKLVGECTEERTHLRNIHFLEILGNDIQKARGTQGLCVLNKEIDLDQYMTSNPLLSSRSGPNS